jgi:hypothetical protein
MFFPPLETNYMARGYIPIYLQWSRLFIIIYFTPYIAPPDLIIPSLVINLMQKNRKRQHKIYLKKQTR